MGVIQIAVGVMDPILTLGVVVFSRPIILTIAHIFSMIVGTRSVILASPTSLLLAIAPIIHFLALVNSYAAALVHHHCAKSVIVLDILLNVVGIVLIMLMSQHIIFPKHLLLLPYQSLGIKIRTGTLIPVLPPT